METRHSPKATVPFFSGMIRIVFVILTITSLITAQSNAEFRATWVITWEYLQANAPPSIIQANIRRVMDRHVQANMNAVILQVRQSGTAYYNSSYEPWGYYVGYQYPGFDPLEYAVEQAHLRGLELHAWFNVFQVSSTASGTPVDEHPEWVCRDQDGYAMQSYRSISPGLEAVRDYTVDVAMEIVNNYDIDGLHLDYVRWNEHTSSFLRSHPATQEQELTRLDGMISGDELAALSSRSGRFLYDYLHPYTGGVPEGYSTWEAWWRDSVTKFVQALHDSIQTVKPHVRLSAAVLGKYNWSGWQGYGSVYQDGALWFNQGYVDQLMPMSYHWTTPGGFYGMLEGDCPDCWGDYIQPGVADGRLFSVGPGSYILDENNVWGRHPSIVDICRTVPWVDGFQFFSYQQWNNHSYWPIAGAGFFVRQTKIRTAVKHPDSRPPAPILTYDIIDSVTVEFTVTPAHDDPGWLLLYRQQSDVISSETGTIIARQFGDDPFTTIVVFPAPLDSDQVIQYAATQADRHWVESPLSQVALISGKPLPVRADIGLPYPNPVSTNVTIPYSLDEFRTIAVDIIDITGRRTRSLLRQLTAPGTHTLFWDGYGSSGKRVANGVYYIVLREDQNILDTQPIVVIKD